jgi:hypothetical protein
MKTIRAAAAICAVSEIAGLFLLIGCQGGSSGMSAMQDAPASVRFPAFGPVVATAIVAAIGNGAPSARAESSRLAWNRATSVFDRRQGETARHQ